MASIHPDVLAIMICPQPGCAATLRLDDGRLECTACGRRYRLEERWPVMIPEEAEAPATNESKGPGS